MNRRLSRRFWVEVVAAAVSGALLAVTVLIPSWIELVFGVDPDHGSGALEWTVVLLALLAWALLSFLAGREWRRCRVVGAVPASTPGAR